MLFPFPPLDYSLTNYRKEDVPGVKNVGVVSVSHLSAWVKQTKSMDTEPEW